MSSNDDNDRCEPCEISVAAGELIHEHCADDCDDIMDRFTKGNMSLRDLQKAIGAPKNALDRYASMAVPLDKSLSKSVKDNNDKKIESSEQKK